MKTAQRAVLVIDDEKNFARVLGREVETMGYAVTVEHTGEAGIARLKEREFDLVILDIRLPGMNGIEALRRIRAVEGPPEVLLLTGHATIETALAAMKAGAYDYLTKPCKLEELEVLLAKAAEKRDAVQSTSSLRRYLGEGPSDCRMIAEGEALRTLLARADKIAVAIDVPVLITGESGTGKELLAREIHRRSPLREQAFVALNCAALPASLVESELFGHERGAFTGATQRKVGLFEVARGGTLFLDEIGELEESVQAKLLRAVQFGEFRRIGSTESQQVQVRLLAATNLDLEQAIAKGRFREDLYYRLNVVQLRLPPLREHPEEILPLARHFLALHGSVRGSFTIDDQAARLLQVYAWPGNVRELENFVRRLLIFQETPNITVADLEGAFAAGPSTTPAGGSLRLEDVEREHIVKVLRLCGGNKTETAQQLGIALKTLYNKLNAYRRTDGE